MRARMMEQIDWYYEEWQTWTKHVEAADFEKIVSKEV